MPASHVTLDIWDFWDQSKKLDDHIGGLQFCPVLAFFKNVHLH
jgi:hypothetical protein